MHDLNLSAKIFNPNLTNLLVVQLPCFVSWTNLFSQQVETLEASFWVGASEHDRILYLRLFHYGHAHTCKQDQFSTAAHSKVCLKMKYPSVSTVYYNWWWRETIRLSSLLQLVIARGDARQQTITKYPTRYKHVICGIRLQLICK